MPEAKPRGTTGLPPQGQGSVSKQAVEPELPPPAEAIPEPVEKAEPVKEKPPLEKLEPTEAEIKQQLKQQEQDYDRPAKPAFTKEEVGIDEVLDPSKVETIYDNFDELRKKFFPEQYAMEPQRFMAQKAEHSVKVPSVEIILPYTVKVMVGEKPVIVGRLNIGGYRVAFKNNEYISKNKLEYKALLNKPGIICMGPAE